MDVLAELAASPALYAMAFDPVRDAMFFIRLRAEDYSRASFLDERALTPGTRGQWIPYADVARAMSSPTRAQPLHFIFHSGHVGSTLLSRLLDESGVVLSLREPLPLRTIADAFDAAAPGADNRLETLVRLWERGFRETQAVILKATSTAERLGTRLLALRNRTRAVTLNVTAETYLATVLAAENSAVDLNAHGPERFHRLGKLMNAALPRPANLGELAAMSWLVERLTQENLVDAFGERVLAMDFDALLRSPESGLGLVFRHFGIPVSPEVVASISAGGTLTRYSKAPEHDYSPELRSAQLAEARSLYSEEIRAALHWLERLGQRHDKLAAIL